VVEDLLPGVIGLSEEEELVGIPVPPRQVRASIRLKPEAAEVWSRLDRASRARLGSIFNELVILYGRIGGIPIIPISAIPQTPDLVVRAFEVYELRREVERLSRELEEVKAKLRG
jgi:hypothetical protein